MNENSLPQNLARSRTVSGLGGWLAFIGFRLVVGMIFSLIALLGMIRNAQNGMYFFYGTDIMMYVSAGLLAATLVLYFAKKKPFITLYIATTVLTIFTNFLAGDNAYAAATLVIETMLICYLLLSRRVANTYHFHIRLNEVPAAPRGEMPQRIVDLSAEKEKVLDDLRRAAEMHQNGALDDAEFAETKCRLLARI